MKKYHIYNKKGQSHLLPFWPNFHRATKVASALYAHMREVRQFTRTSHPLAFISLAKSYKHYKGYYEKNHLHEETLHVTLRARSEEDCRSPNFWTSQSCSLLSNWFFECEHPFIDNRARCRRHTAIRPGFETISKQRAARAQHRSYSIHTESFSSTLEYAKFEQAKERPHMYVQLILCCRHLQNIIPK